MKFTILLIYITSSILEINCDKFEATLGHLSTNSRRNSESQKNAVEGLINRTLPKEAGKFSVIIDASQIENEKDFFRIKSLPNGTIQIFGTNGVAAATGFHYYLKYYCQCHISWETQQLNLPKILPSVNIKINFNDRFRYYQNVCTTSYSFVWWDWEQWEKHIDWMVMNSFNLVLAFNGQEAIWSELYQELGLSQDDIDNYFAGPAFLSWQRMGNLRRWGGPLSFGWHRRSLNLQKAIVKRLRSFGVITVLPAFAGHLPRAFKRLYPNANMVKLGSWNNFNDTYCCPYFLDPTSELFNQIGRMFIKKQISEYGTDNIYSCDSFNENTPPSTDLDYLSNVSSSIFNAMTSADPKAVWLMQNWLFVHDMDFWTKERARSLITAVPKGRMIILDLQSEQYPQYLLMDQYFGQPFIWCMLHNFGGTLGMYGNSDIINERPIEARIAENSTMIGTGLTMEGINQNYVIYDLMTESAWRNKPTNLSTWFADYSIRRYGQKNTDVIEAWTNLQETVYNLKTLRRMRGQYAITKTPSWSIKTWIWYDAKIMNQAISKFMNASSILKDNLGYQHDLVDLLRQAVQVFNDQAFNQIKRGYSKRNLQNFRLWSHVFVAMLNSTEPILATSKAFSLNEWVKSARDAGTNPLEKDWFEYIARNQITLWGPNGEIMNYAIKQWSGVVSDFLLPRWQVFLEYADRTLVGNQTFNDTFIKQIMFETVEEPFTFKKTEVFHEPKGNTIEAIKEFVGKWWKVIETFGGMKDKDLNNIYRFNITDVTCLMDQVQFTDDDIKLEIIR